jgi:hypothetical protein
MDNLIRCWHCSGTIGAGDAYCRYCGKGQGQSVPFRYTHAGMIVMSLLIGPLALPFIWKSPEIGRNFRIAYIIINLLITFFMLSLVFGIYSSVNRQVQDTMKIIQQTGLGSGR